MIVYSLYACGFLASFQYIIGLLIKKKKNFRLGKLRILHCVTFPESGKIRGIAIISLKTEAAAKRALVLDGADRGELFQEIQHSSMQLRGSKCKLVVVKQFIFSLNHLSGCPHSCHGPAG